MTDRSYDEVLNGIAMGTRHTADDWPVWFDQADGDFEGKVADVFFEYGIFPTPAQFAEAQAAEPAEEEPEMQPEEVPAKAARKSAKSADED